MTDDWLWEMDKGNIIGTVLLDFSAAFDLIDHKILLKKLECYGFSEAAVQFFNNYLCDRKQLVYYNGCYSNAQTVKHGVPQGSCLGPLLYSIFTNDLPLVLDKADISMFADDTTIYLAGKTIAEVRTELERELNNIVNWVENNKLVLNVGKTTSIIIGSKHSLRAKPQLNISIKNTIIKQIEEIKLLGVCIDSQLSWDKQVNNVVSKMGRSIAVIRRCSKYLTKPMIPYVIQSLVLSHLDYCAVVWSNTSLNNIKKLQLVQNKAARVALGCGFRANVVKMHKRLSWLWVKDRWLYAKSNFLRNIITTQTPSIFFDELPFSKNTHAYPTRHSEGQCFTLPKCRTSQSQRTVMFSAMKEWNHLPQEIRELCSGPAFKKELKKHYSKQMVENM